MRVRSVHLMRLYCISVPCGTALQDAIRTEPVDFARFLAVLTFGFSVLVAAAACLRLRAVVFGSNTVAALVSSCFCGACALGASRCDEMAKTEATLLGAVGTLALPALFIWPLRDQHADRWAAGRGLIKTAIGAIATSLCAYRLTTLSRGEASRTLVFSPTGGLGNALYGASSAALLAHLTCRRFIYNWGADESNTAAAAFESLFERPVGARTCATYERSGCHINLQHTTPKEQWQALHDDVAAFSASRGECIVLRVTSSQYFVPLLRAARRSSCVAPVPTDSLHSPSGDNYFGRASRKLFRPLAEAVDRSEQIVREMRGRRARPVIGVHVRSRQVCSLADRHIRMDTEQMQRVMLACWRRYFGGCVRRLQGRFNGTARVYVSADTVEMRQAARSDLGKVWWIDPPSYLALPTFDSVEQWRRGPKQVISALDELLILARTDAIVVYDLKRSTYGAAAASWAVAGAAGLATPAHALERPSRWLGAFKAGTGCTHVHDAAVEPIPNGLPPLLLHTNRSASRGRRARPTGSRNPRPPARHTPI